MIFLSRQERFTCENCQYVVPIIEHGSCRNHCPQCLWSKHVDLDGPGDRASTCLGLMKPIGVEHSGKKGWSIVHLCEKCSKESVNISAPDDNVEELSRIGVSE